MKPETPYGKAARSRALADTKMISDVAHILKIDWDEVAMAAIHAYEVVKEEWEDDGK